MARWNTERQQLDAEERDVLGHMDSVRIHLERIMEMRADVERSCL